MTSSVPTAPGRPVDTAEPSAVLTHRAAAWVIATLVLATFGEGVLLGVIPAVVSGVGALFGKSAGALNWVNTVQLLSAGVCTPVFGRLGDMYGHRRLLRIAVALSLIGAILCAVAPNFAVLLVGRALEGTIATFTSLGIGIARDRLPVDRQRVAMTSIVAGLTGGSAIGLLVAAEAYAGWGSVRAVLWIPVVFFAVSLVLLLTAVPETLRRAAVRVDWLGGLTLSSGLALLLLAVAKGHTWGWTSGSTVSCFVAAAALLAAWVAAELRVDEPMVDLRVAAHRSVAPFYLASITIGVAFFGAQTATSTFLASPHRQLGYGFGLDITHIALSLLPGAALGVLGSLIVAPLARRWGHKATLYAGCAVMAIGYGALAQWHDHLAQLIIAVCVANLGIGIVSGGMPVVLAERAQRTATGIATGLFNTAKSVGGSTAGAVFAAVLSGIAIAHTDIPREHAYVVVWLACGACALISLLVIAAAIGRGAGEDQADPAGA